MIGLVTIAAGRHDHLRLQLRGVSVGARPELHVVVAMGDPQIADVVAGRAEVLDVPLVEGRLPLAAARNAGAARAIDGGADALVFLDVDCVPSPSTVDEYRAALGARPDAIVSGQVGYLPPPGDGYVLERLAALGRAHPARAVPAGSPAVPLAHELVWSLSFGVTATTWERIGGFDEAYTGYGGEDTDFGLRARAAGVPHLGLAQAWSYHQWHPSADPPVTHLDDILRNGRVFRQRWGHWPMTGWLEAFERMGLVRHDPDADEWTAAARDPSARPG
ncbi:glycosyltransferase family 2 protein [Jatrophihabitans fulvus]